jgi:hypothetical protein
MPASMQQQHAALGAVALGRRLEGVDQLHQRPIQTEDGVAVLGGVLGEEPVANDLLLVLEHLLGAVREDHVIQALIGRPRDLRVLAHDVEILVERAFPVDLTVIAQVQLLANAGKNGFTCRHRCHLHGRCSLPHRLVKARGCPWPVGPPDRNGLWNRPAWSRGPPGRLATAARGTWILRFVWESFTRMTSGPAPGRTIRPAANSCRCVALI